MDKIAFKNTFLPLGEKLYIIAFKLIGNAMEAEDMVQETYLKLWNKRDELDDLNSPIAFAVTVIKNLCLDYLNSNKFKLQANQVEIEKCEDFDNEIDFEKRESLKIVYSIINHLPPPQKEVILLRHIKGLSIEEIEKVTGYSSVNIRVLLSRARKKMKEQLNIYQKGTIEY
ncbi:MAG: sigma-70 family RNA polymerase sigma factor [Bacteroidales bacterium]|nr:sigma-70 family RNA polymerase sigma factor [Bacteroidales bacterium]